MRADVLRNGADRNIYVYPFNCAKPRSLYEVYLRRKRNGKTNTVNVSAGIRIRSISLNGLPGFLALGGLLNSKIY